MNLSNVEICLFVIVLLPLVLGCVALLWCLAEIVITDIAEGGRARWLTILALAWFLALIALLVLNSGCAPGPDQLIVPDAIPWNEARTLEQIIEMQRPETARGAKP